MMIRTPHPQQTLRRARLRLFGIVAICLFVTCSPCVLTAQEGRTSATRTLEEVKADGTLRSSYRGLVSKPENVDAPQADLKAFRQQISPILTDTCLDCHGPETAEGELNVDKLGP